MRMSTPCGQCACAYACVCVGLRTADVDHTEGEILEHKVGLFDARGPEASAEHVLITGLVVRVDHSIDFVKEAAGGATISDTMG